MLWTVAHRCPKSSRFAFNCYRHFPQLLARVPGDRTPKIILSKEGVTQGDPMAMPLYGISVAVLSEQLNREFPSSMQFWYANDFSATASGGAARPLMKRLGEIGFLRGIFPEPAKSQYVCPAQVTEESAKISTKGTTLKHEAGAWTLGRHIGSPETRDAWITTQVNDWAHGVKALGKIVTRFPQTSYAGLVKALQNKWTYLQRFTTGNRGLYEPIEKAITDDFLPALLGQSNIG